MVINSTIAEIDIEKASPSIWLAMGKITQEKYDYLVSLPRQKRQVETGMMRREDHTLTDALKEGYDIYIGKLKKANKISDKTILIRNHDALFLIDHIPEKLEFGVVKFAVKNIYDLYYKYNNFEFFLTTITNKLKTRGVNNSFSISNSKLLALIQDVMIAFLNSDKEKCYKMLHTARRTLEKDYEAYGPGISQSLDSNLKIIKHMIVYFT